MDLNKLRAVCQDICKKTRSPREVNEEGKSVGRPFTEKELRRIAAHSDLWWSDLCEAFGIEE